MLSKGTSPTDFRQYFLTSCRGDQCLWGCIWWCIHKSANCYSPWMQPWCRWNEDIVSTPSSTWVLCICDIWCLSHDQTGEKSLWWFENHSIIEWWGAEVDPMVLPWGFECCSGNAWLFLCKQAEKEAHYMAEAQDACQLSCANTEQLCGWCHWLPVWWACSVNFKKWSNNRVHQENWCHVAPVTLTNFSRWSQTCDETCAYLLSFRDCQGNLLYNGKCKTAICGLVFSMQSIKTIACHLLTRESNPFRYFLTYKLSQDSIELLLHKIRHRCGWNNNPNALQFKYALQRILGWNSIEPSKTGNCTPFEDSLTQVGGHQFLKQKADGWSSHWNFWPKCHLGWTHAPTQWHQQSTPTERQHTVLHCWYTVWSLLAKVSCETCKGELLLDPTDAHASQLPVGPLCAKFTAFKQRGRLVFPSTAVFNVVRITESVFHRHAVGAGTSVPNEKNMTWRSKVLSLNKWA